MIANTELRVPINLNKKPIRKVECSNRPYSRYTGLRPAQQGVSTGVR